jgi:uncharacterized membrane protein
MDEEEIFDVRVAPIVVFTVIVVIIFAVYGAASAGRDIVALALKAHGIL